MAREQTPSTREGALLRRARQRLRPRLSMAEAAQGAGISEDYWGHIERGYQSMGKGQPPRQVIAPSDTLAHMARAVSLTPDELSEAGRDDAAAVLADLLGSERESPPVISEGLRRAVSDLRAKAAAEHRSVGQVLVEAGVDPEELVIPDALPKDPIIAEIEAEDIPRESKDRLIGIYLSHRTELLEAERKRAESQRGRPGT